MARSELYDINGSGAKGIELAFAGNEGGKGFYVCATSFLQRFIKGESLFGAEILCGNNEGDFDDKSVFLGQLRVCASFFY